MTVLWAGLALGALYALVAMLFNIGMAQAGVFNFAVPQVLMAGAFVGYEFSGSGLASVPVLIVVALLVGGLLGLLIDLLAVRPASRGGHGILITTVGAAFVVEGAAFIVYGVDGHNVTLFGLNRQFDLLGGRLAAVDVVIMVVAVAAIAAIQFLTRRSRWGLEGRAATLDSESASLRGVNVVVNRAQAFVLAGALAAAIGVLAAVKINASFSLGTSLLVYSFVAFTVGGIGSFPGCLAGGVIVGLLQAYTGRYIGAEYSLMLAFFLLLIVLLTRPTGLFGNRQLRIV
jgi:branched-chain amino acid transport system permease protein